MRQLSVSVEGETSSQTYTYVETDFIKALKNGYLVEIQEPSTILQPGVLVGLNSLLEQSGTITLPTGGSSAATRTRLWWSLPTSAMKDAERSIKALWTG